jgi:hypothetical protein
MARLRFGHTLALRGFLNRCRFALRVLLGKGEFIPYSEAGPTPYSASELLDEYRHAKGSDKPVTIDWHAVAVMMANKWLARHEPEELDEIAFVDSDGSNSELITRLSDRVARNELPGLNVPYCIIVWRGRGGKCGIQVIANKERA